MDIYEKALELWQKIDDPLSFNYEKRFIFDNEFVGKENNCLLSIPKSMILLDGELNELHILKKAKDKTQFSHHNVLLTPQPLEKFTRIELSPSKLYIALIGRDSVSLVDIHNISTEKTCKKNKEIFSTKDVIVAVKWYPRIYDFLVILTNQSVNVYRVHSDMVVSNYYEYRLNNDIDSSKSFGIREEFAGFDFGTVNYSNNDNSLFILKDSGDIFFLPELKQLNKKSHNPKQLFFDPPSTDNYQDDFVSIIVLRGLIDVIVLANRHGVIQHAVFVNNKICVYDTVTIPFSSGYNNPSELNLIVDETAYPPRYFITNSFGIQSCILPWAVRLRMALKSGSDAELESCLNNSGISIFDWILKTNVSSIDNTSSDCQVRFAGLSVVRGASVAPELCVMQCRDKKLLTKIKLRQETTLMLANELINFDKIQLDSTGVGLMENKRTESRFLQLFMEELGKAHRLPILSSNLIGKETSDVDKVTLVLQMNETANEYGTHLNSAGKILEQRLHQLKSITNQQKNQLVNIQNIVHDLKQKARDLDKRYERASSRQKNILNRLSICSDKISEINGVSPIADKDAIKKINDLKKQIKSTQTLLRSCKLRFEQSEPFFDEVDQEERNIEFPRLYIDNLHEHLKLEDTEITQLITDIKLLMKT